MPGRSDYVDLFLIHWPLPTLYGGDFVSTWTVLDEFARDGRARSIGVSNFQPDHLNRLAKESCAIPVAWQQGRCDPVRSEGIARPNHSGESRYPGRAHRRRRRFGAPHICRPRRRFR
jgi:diketogulonate reductase-like aldo/keto reductase